MEKLQYITTPIYYVNGEPHIGHAHTSVMADIIKRMLKQQGNEVFLTTGVDEHGQKNQEEIEKLGISSSEYLNKQSRKFSDLFDRLSVSYDYFVRTSAESHVRTVKNVLSYFWEKKLINKKEYTGLYCKGCEQFKTVSDLDDKGCCPDHHTKPSVESENNYFFALEPFRESLIDYIKSNPDWIKPSFYRNKVLDMLSKPLEDLCVSRPKSRVNLGIELPFDKNFVTYVWFDALLNYISNIGFGNDTKRFDSLWNRSVHLMAKDIIKTHCIYWPIMLKALDLQPVTNNFIHGFWVGEDGRKMSKSLGNGVDPTEIIDIYGEDCLRFFLASKLGKSESRIGKKLIDEFYSSVMVNIFGNTYLRVLKLLKKYVNGVIPDRNSISPSDLQFIQAITKKLGYIVNTLPDLEFIGKAAKDITDIGRTINKYIDDTAPWILARDEETKTRVPGILLVCIEAVRILFEAAYPFIPGISEKVFSSMKLSYPKADLPAYECMPFKLVTGTEINNPEILFPKL